MGAPWELKYGRGCYKATCTSNLLVVFAMMDRCKPDTQVRKVSRPYKNPEPNAVVKYVHLLLKIF